MVWSRTYSLGPNLWDKKNIKCIITRSIMRDCQDGNIIPLGGGKQAEESGSTRLGLLDASPKIFFFFKGAHIHTNT